MCAFETAYNRQRLRRTSYVDVKRRFNTSYVNVYAKNLIPSTINISSYFYLSIGRLNLIGTLLISMFLVVLTTNAFAAPPPAMRNPKDIELSGLERRASLSSPIGRIELRWTRESERLFGKTPERATIEAASSVAKALKQSSFPSSIKLLNINWQIVFLSKDLKGGQVPNMLLSNCHPGWMTPPANIYIASEQVAGGCGGKAPTPGKIADSQLARVLIHELGHAVEFALAPNLGGDRARSEGFATWFEVFASRYSSLLDSGSLLNEQKFLARQRAGIADKRFLGSAADYSLAAVFFHLITENRTVSDLSRVYQQMSAERISFIQSLRKVMGWSEKQLDQKVKEFVNSSAR